MKPLLLGPIITKDLGKGLFGLMNNQSERNDIIK